MLRESQADEAYHVRRERSTDKEEAVEDNLRTGRPNVVKRCASISTGANEKVYCVMPLRSGREAECNACSDRTFIWGKQGREAEARPLGTRRPTL
eukprot:scaffold770_cov362-Pavlova_lutheri.AAC.26